jgi:hypothetical protein
MALRVSSYIRRKFAWCAETLSFEIFSTYLKTLFTFYGPKYKNNAFQEAATVTALVEVILYNAPSIQFTASLHKQFVCFVKTTNVKRGSL